MPDGGAGDDLDQAFAAAIPPSHLEASPARLGIGEARRQGWLALADHARPTLGAGPAARWRVEQPGIETRAGNHTDPAPHVIEQFDGGEAAVADRDDPPVGEPARRLQQNLPTPIGELLVPPLVFARITFG